MQGWTEAVSRPRDWKEALELRAGAKQPQLSAREIEERREWRAKAIANQPPISLEELHLEVRLLAEAHDFSVKSRIHDTHNMHLLLQRLAERVKALEAERGAP